MLLYENFELFSVFVRKKITINVNIRFVDHASGIHLPDGFRLDAN